MNKVTKVVYILLFLFIPILGLVGLLEYTNDKHYDTILAFSKKNPKLFKIALALVIMLQLSLSVFIISIFN